MEFLNDNGRFKSQGCPESAPPGLIEEYHQLREQPELQRPLAPSYLGEHFAGEGFQDPNDDLKTAGHNCILE